MGEEISGRRATGGRTYLVDGWETRVYGDNKKQNRFLKILVVAKM